MRMHCNFALFIISFAIFIVILNTAAKAEDSNEFVKQLNEDNIRQFLDTTKNVSMGLREDMTPEDIEAYLQRHLFPKGSFRSMTKFEIPGYPAQEKELKLSREEYIQSIIEGRNLIADYETNIEVKNIKIDYAGLSATVKTISADKGKLPWPDGQGSEKIVPIKGQSECEQKLVVSANNYIQMAHADCQTTIKFLPFGDEPLGR